MASFLSLSNPVLESRGTAEGHTSGERVDSSEKARFALGTLKLWMFPLAKWAQGGRMWTDRGVNMQRTVSSNAHPPVFV